MKAFKALCQDTSIYQRAREPHRSELYSDPDFDPDIVDDLI